MDVLNVTNQVIHCQIHCKITFASFIVSFMYGLHSIASRPSLWDFINSNGKDFTLPWFLVGDYNNIRSPSDKKHGLDVTADEVSDFNSCCFSTNLIDLKTLGSKLTWWNGSIFYWIDRAIVNPSWQLQFPYNFAHAAAFGPLSDHTEIIISRGSETTAGKKGLNSAMS